MSNAKVTPKSFNEFFNELLEAVLAKDKIPVDIAKCPKLDGRCYRYIPTGIKDTHFEWYFDEKRKSFKIGIHFESTDANKNKLLFDIIWNSNNIIEEKTKEEVKILKHERNIWRGIYIEKQTSELNEEVKEWAIKKMNIFYHAVNEEVKKFIRTLEKF